MTLGLADVLALQGKSEEAVEWMERGLPLYRKRKTEVNNSRGALLLVFKMRKSGKGEKTRVGTAAYAGESRSDPAPDFTAAEHGGDQCEY